MNEQHEQLWKLNNASKRLENAKQYITYDSKTFHMHTPVQKMTVLNSSKSSIFTQNAALSTTDGRNSNKHHRFGENRHFQAIIRMSEYLSDHNHHESVEL